MQKERRVSYPPLPPETPVSPPRPACPLCGSPDAEVLISSNTTWLTECPHCVGRGTSFWVTVQAGARSLRERGDGRRVDPERARHLMVRRIDEGGPAYVRQDDLDDLLIDS